MKRSLPLRMSLKEENITESEDIYDDNDLTEDLVLKILCNGVLKNAAAQDEWMLNVDMMKKVTHTILHFKRLFCHRNYEKVN